MKMECPVCGQVGILEQRGNSQRVIHYRYVDGKRVFEKHTITDIVNGNRMGTAKGTEKQDLSLNGRNPSLAVGLRRGARGPLNHKPPTRWAESLGEASKIIKTPQPSAGEYPSSGAGGRGAAFAGRLFPRSPGEPGQAREGAT